jgi:hypothetical protein
MQILSPSVLIANQVQAAPSAPLSSPDDALVVNNDGASREVESAAAASKEKGVILRRDEAIGYAFYTRTQKENAYEQGQYAHAMFVLSQNTSRAGIQVKAGQSSRAGRFESH